MWWLVGNAAASSDAHEAGGEGQAHEGQAEGHGGGHGGGHGPVEIPTGKLAVQSASFLIFLAILYAVGAQPIRDTLRKRAGGIRKSIDEAIDQKKGAEARFADIESRLAGLDKQIADMKALAAREADMEAERLREKAAQEGQRIQEVAERTIRDEGARARRALRDESIRLATELARQKASVAINGEDQRRLAREFLDSITAAAQKEAR